MELWRETVNEKERRRSKKAGRGMRGSTEESRQRGRVMGRS